MLQLCLPNIVNGAPVEPGIRRNTQLYMHFFCISIMNVFCTYNRHYVALCGYILSSCFNKSTTIFPHYLPLIVTCKLHKQLTFSFCALILKPMHSQIKYCYD